ncbi:MAG: response regulator [Desulfovibrio sp.]|nr:MAG: response regulator [Desulfovibrio sp.]
MESSELTEHSITVLIIDDQAMVCEAVRRMLEGESDIEFHSLQDPTKAIETAEAINPTVILQDLVMPDIDGLTLVKFFRANAKTKDIPLIVLSSKEEATTKAEAFALGANDYLVKLPDQIELIARIRYHSTGYINLLQRNEAFARLQASQQALAAELAQAEKYVRKLLPHEVKSGPVQTEWEFVPSAQLGGDAFGYFWLDDDNFVMYLLDVCDHGVGSALLSVSAMNTVNSQTLPNVDFKNPGEVLTGLNEAFQMEMHNNLYFTMWYGVYNTKSRRLTYASGGPPPALLKTGGSSEFQELHTPGLMIGGMAGMEFQARETEVQGPSKLFFFSDGVYEITKPDGKVLLYQEFAEYLTHSEPGVSDITRVRDYAVSLQGRDTFDDDFSMVMVRFE